MDIIRHCAEQPNIHARALLRSRALDERQIDLFLILACAQLTRSYILYRHEQSAATPDELDIDTLLRRISIPTLAARTGLDTAFTSRVVRELAPVLIAQLHHALGSDHSLMHLFDQHNAA